MTTHCRPGESAVLALEGAAATIEAGGHWR